jgi:hypothetical protein
MPTQRTTYLGLKLKAIAEQEHPAAGQRYNLARLYVARGPGLPPFGVERPEAADLHLPAGGNALHHLGQESLQDGAGNIKRAPGPFDRGVGQIVPVRVEHQPIIQRPRRENNDAKVMEMDFRRERLWPTG